MIPLLIVFIVGMMAGVIRGYRLIRAGRKADPRDDTLYEWSGKPLQAWKYEFYASAAILIHTISILVLGFLALRASSHQGVINNPLFAHDITMIVLTWLIQYGCLAIISYQLGSVLITFLLITFRSQPVAVAITGKGISSGKIFAPWGRFSHFSIDSDRGILRLYSAFAPDLPSFILKLPESITLAELDKTMHDFLPIRPAEGNLAWYRTKLMLIPMMFLTCLLVVALGWLAYHLPMEFSLFIIALLTVLLIYLGGLVLNLFAFGIHPTRNNSPGTPPAV